MKFYDTNQTYGLGYKQSCLVDWPYDIAVPEHAEPLVRNYYFETLLDALSELQRVFKESADRNFEMNNQMLFKSYAVLQISADDIRAKDCKSLLLVYDESDVDKWWPAEDFFLMSGTNRFVGL